MEIEGSLLCSHKLCATFCNKLASYSRELLVTHHNFQAREPLPVSSLGLLIQYI